MKKKNQDTHLYTLIVRPDNSYKVLFDLKEKVSGNIISDDEWDFPKKEIDDPEDKKPSNWVDIKTIPDPNDHKPEGHDNIPAQIPDPDAKMPEDWDENEDGVWEQPKIDNPEYKGPWKQKTIPNPEYKGEWKAKQIPNKDFKEDVYAYDDIGVVGYELWVVNSGSLFDNIYIGDSITEAEEYAKETFTATIEKEKAMKKEQDDKKKAEEDAKKPDDHDHDDHDHDHDHGHDDVYGEADEL